MDFILCGAPIHDARNIEWQSNEDGTGQFWFTALMKDKNGEEHNVRFHIFRLRTDPLMSIESVDNKLYEAEIVDNSF